MTIPRGLKAPGKKLWQEITEGFELSAAEFRLLEHACRELDLIDRIDRELANGSMFVQGYNGQPVSNPLLTEVRQHRSTYASLMNKLELPSDDNRSSRSASARQLANARWARGA